MFYQFYCLPVMSLDIQLLLLVDAQLSHLLLRVKPDDHDEDDNDHDDADDDNLIIPRLML